MQVLIERGRECERERDRDFDFLRGIAYWEGERKIFKKILLEIFSGLIPSPNKMYRFI